MASDDEELNEIDEELARLEREIQELEDEAGQPPEPDAPDPEADADVPEPGEVFEGEAEVEETEGLFSRIVNRFRSEEDAEETDGQDEAPEATEEDDEELDLATGRAEDEPPDADLEEATEAPQPTEDAEDDEDLEGVGQASGDEQEAVSPFPEPSDEPEEFEEPQRSAPLEQAPPAPSDAEAAEAGPAPALPPREEPASLAPEDGAEEAPAPEEGDEEASSLWGKLTGRLPGSLAGGSPAVSATVADPGGGISRRNRPPAGAGHAYEAVEASGGVALFDRFRGSQADEEEEDEDRRGIIVGVLIAVLLLALLAVGAYYVLGDGGGGDLSADLVADSFTTEDGSYVAMRGEAITLDAGASSGEPEEFRWDFGDGTEQTTSEPTVQHTYEERGSYTVELVVVAGRSQQSTEIGIAVVDPPDPQPQILLDGEPVAEPATVGNNVFVGDTVTLDGTASRADADYAISSYSWDVDGDGEPDATGPTAELGFEERGAWNVTLTVGDELGNEASQSQRVHVSDRIVIEDTVGPSTDEADSNDHEVSIEEARQGAVPIELQLQLTYEASANDTGGLPVQPVVEPNLDLEVSDPENNTYEAEDDEGAGNETLTVSGGELTALGMWNITVTQDNQNAGTASEVEYELVVETIY